MIDLSMLPGPYAPRSSAITVGTFDGIHRGHQQVLAELARVARSRGERSVLITFDPHPLRIVRPASAPQLLTTRSEKQKIIATYDVDVVAFIPFTYELSQYDPERFVREILLDNFGLAHLVIGYDHGFGRGRSGDVETLIKIGSQIGFGVDVVEPYRIDGDNVSSSKIRTLLQAGDVRAAAEALGRPYTMEGDVGRGDGRGRDLGMPTANLDITAEKLIPRDGIYAVRAGIGTGSGKEIRTGPGGRHRKSAAMGRQAEISDWHEAVMHIGPRPTFEEASAAIEVHLFDWEHDLYGRRLSIEMYKRLRDVEKFDSPADLAVAMRADAKAARSYFSR